MRFKLLQNVYEVCERTADSIQLIDDDFTDSSLPNQFHHLLKSITFYIAARKTVVNKCDDLFGLLIRLDHHPAVLKLRITTNAVLTFNRFTSIKNNGH